MIFRQDITIYASNPMSNRSLHPTALIVRNEDTRMTSADDLCKQSNKDAQGGERKPFTEPILTRHQPLTNITRFTSGLNVAGVTFF